MTTQTYTVPATNKLSGATFEARIAATEGAPRVESVEIGSWEWVETSGEVLVKFETWTLAYGPGRPFSFDVTCEARDGDGRRLLVTDGDRRLDSFSQIDAAYDVRGEISAVRWREVVDLDVRVTVDDPA